MSFLIHLYDFIYHLYSDSKFISPSFMSPRILTSFIELPLKSHWSPSFNMTKIALGIIFHLAYIIMIKDNTFLHLLRLKSKNYLWFPLSTFLPSLDLDISHYLQACHPNLSYYYSLCENWKTLSVDLPASFPLPSN